MSTPNSGEVTIRTSTAADLPAIRRLAALDSAAVPNGELLLAELDRELVAAFAVADGRVIADPFVHTSALVEMLGSRARRPVRKDRRSGLRRLSLAMRAGR